MAYTPPKTWVAGEKLLATDVMANLDAIRVYSSALPSNSVAVEKWIDSKHVVRGEYDPVLNQSRMVSGIFGGVQVKNNEDFTYVTVYNTTRGDADTWREMPGTGVTLEVRRACSVMVNWWMSAKSSNNFSAGALGETQLRLYVGTPDLRYGEPVLMTEEDTSLNYRRRCYRQVPGGFYVSDFTVGTYKVGICGQSTTSKTYGFAWGLSFEAFAL